MKKYLMGISTYCDNLIEQGMVDIKSIDGLFDNSEKLCQKKRYGLTIQKPYFDSDIEIIITIRKRYWLEIIRQLLELGYRKFTLFEIVNKNFVKRTLDYSKLDYEKEKTSLVLLILEHRSYSGITALDYLTRRNIVDTHGIRVKYFECDEKDEFYYYDVITARYIITERKWKKREDIFKAQIIQMWHGYPLKAMGKMITWYDEKKEEKGSYWKDYDFILSYGLNYTTFICACYGTIYKRFVETGMPRNDLIFVTDGKKNLEEIFPDSIGKKVVLYMPTFRETDGVVNGDDEGYIFYWEEFEVEKLEQFCRKNNIFFLFKLHPSDESKVREWCVECDCMGVLTDELLGDKAMYEILNAADVLVTDYSSVYFDYLLLDRPIVFTNRDEESYIKNRGLILEPLDFWRPGPVVNNMISFEKEIESVIQGRDDYKEERTRLMPFVHKHKDGNSTQRLFDFLKENAERSAD